MPKKYLKKILDARVYEVAVETPLQLAPTLSKRFNNQIFLKREDLQAVHSFKLRGAYNKMAQLSQQQKQAGVICASAGNHAQGVALSAKKLGIKATIVMPKTTPAIKISAVRDLGGKAVLIGDTFDEAFQHSLKLAQEKQLTYVHPYDDADVIAGQGTVAVEMLRQHPGKIDAIFVPVGGGGLIAGIAAYVKFVRPDIKIIGVESDESACLTAAMKHGRRVTLPQVGIFADGIAVAQIGKEPFRIIKSTVDQVITVSSDEICAAIKDIFDDTRSIAEPAGATAVAGMKKYINQHQISDQTMLVIESGANLNFDRLRHIAERAELGEKREAIICVTIPEKPGSFKAFCNALGKRNITEFNYRFSQNKDAQIFVGVQLPEHHPDSPNEKTLLLNSLGEKGYPVVDLSDNEVAKLHTRYMVGGHTDQIENEQVFRFEFPERPGALSSFLNTLGQTWNISMFHYRNHGAAYGRVLVGIQAPKKDQKKLDQFLKKTGYPYQMETDNDAYKLFLG
ncbi:MAG: threonine ammonia-lyase, biosynthetic [Pseudomonadales bacterium]|nr:threonine ammonia-lyase, biosynthetic [Pseudomonadales bacterium]